MATVSVRYVVENVDAAIEFYCARLGFHLEMYPAAGFAMLSRGDLRLLLSAPGAGPGGGGRCHDRTAGCPSPADGTGSSWRCRTCPPWWRRCAGRAHLPQRVVVRVGGKQILLEDPSGNPVELFEPARPEAAL